MTKRTIDYWRLAVWAPYLLLAITPACGGSTGEDDEKRTTTGSGGNDANDGSGGQAPTTSGGSTAASGGDENAIGGGGAQASGGSTIDASGGRGGEDCSPSTCEELNTCGNTDDGCATTLDCGPCNEECVPTTCAAMGKDCGLVDDGCEGSIDCGTCDADVICGAVTTNICGCSDNEPLTAGPRHAQRGRSAGFSGTDTQYSELYEQLCSVPADCTTPCVERGGSEEFCSHHACIDSDDDYCLPPTKWRGLSQLLFEGLGTTDAAVTSLSTSNGPDHDRLIGDDFKLEVPEDAIIQGITIIVRHAADSGGASDQAIRLVKDGVIGESDRSLPSLWSTDFEKIVYGGPSDMWGETWTPADVNSADFGVAVAALPASTGGRAYVDIVYATIHYTLACD